MKKLFNLFLVALLCVGPIFAQGSKHANGSLVAASSYAQNCSPENSCVILGGSPNFATTVVELTSQTTNLFHGTVDFEATAGGDWVPIIGTPLTGGSTVTTTTATGTFTFATSGLLNFRVRVEYYNGGALGVDIQGAETGR